MQTEGWNRSSQIESDVIHKDANAQCQYQRSKSHIHSDKNCDREGLCFGFGMEVPYGAPGPGFRSLESVMSSSEEGERFRRGVVGSTNYKVCF